MGPRETPLEMWPVQLVKVREEREMAPVLEVGWAYQSGLREGLAVVLWRGWRGKGTYIDRYPSRKCNRRTRNFRKRNGVFDIAFCTRTTGQGLDHQHLCVS